MILPNVHVLSIFKIGCTKLWCSVHFTFSSVAQSFPTLCDPMGCSTPGFPVHHQLLELAQLKSIESVIPSNHLILCCPLLLLPSIFPSISKIPWRRKWQPTPIFLPGKSHAQRNLEDCSPWHLKELDCKDKEHIKFSTWIIKGTFHPWQDPHWMDMVF